MRITDTTRMIDVSNSRKIKVLFELFIKITITVGRTYNRKNIQ